MYHPASLMSFLDPLVYLGTCLDLTWNRNTGRNHYIKSIEFRIPLKLSMTKIKKQKYFLLPDHQFAEDFILVFGFYERTNKK